MGSSAAEARLVAFYAGRGTDDAGRSFDSVLSFDLARLETTHDYIQWLFPLPEPSTFNPETPVLTERVILALQGDPRLMARVRRSLERMLSFYGLALEVGAEGPKVVPGTDWKERQAEWLRPNNHNHLRLTRILRSIYLLGLREEAAALGRFLDRIAADNPGTVTLVTRAFWERASRGQP
jgi:hypothetical protein